MNTLPFPWAIASLCISVSLLKRDIIRVVLEEARHWNEALVFHIRTAASSSEMCTNAYSQRIKQAPHKLKTNQPLRGAEGRTGKPKELFVQIKSSQPPGLLEQDALRLPSPFHLVWLKQYFSAGHPLEQGAGNWTGSHSS